MQAAGGEAGMGKNCGSALLRCSVPANLVGCLGAHFRFQTVNNIMLRFLLPLLRPLYMLLWYFATVTGG